MKLNPKSSEYVWAFGNEIYESKDSFLAAFCEYNKEIIEKEFVDFTLIDCTKIRIQFMGLPQGADEYNDELCVDFESSNGKEIKFSDLMYFLNQHLHLFLKNADHKFYEGFNLKKCGLVPVLEMLQGS